MTAPTIKLQQDTGVSNTDNITSDFQLKVNNSAANNINYSFLVSGNGLALTGWLSYSAYTAWMGGNENNVENAQFLVQATPNSNISSIGNVINSALIGSLNFTLDETGAVETVNSMQLSSYYSLSGTDYVTKVAEQTLTGTLSSYLAPGDTVMVSLNNGKTWTQAAATVGQYTWSLGAVLTEGNNQILAYVQDAAGNVQPSYSLSYTLATHAPTVTDSQSVSGLTNATADVITVTAGAEAVNGDSIASVAIYNGANFQGYATPNGNGAWTYNAYLADGGVNAFHALVTDSAGNTKTTAALAAVKVAAQAPTVSILESESGLVNGTKDTLTISATPDAAATTGNSIATVAVYDGATLLGDARANGNGVWSYTAANLADGNHNFSAVVTDKAGNVGTTEAASVTVASQAPAVSQFESNSGLNSSATDAITVNATAENIFGNAIQSVTIYDKDNSYFTGQAYLQNNGAWTYTAYNLSGKHQFYAVVTDNAGNIVTTPALPADYVSANGPVMSINGTLPAIGNGQYQTITVNAASESVNGDYVKNIEIYAVYNNGGKTDLGAATFDGNGVWSYANASPLADGAYTFSAVMTDKLGETTTETLSTVAVATQAPTASAAESISGQTTSDSDTITVTANAENVAGDSIATVAIYDNGGFLGDASATGNGVWSYTANNLVVGNHNFYAVVTDAAGNNTQTSVLNELTVENNSPFNSNPINTLSSGVNGPASLATDKNGNVYVANGSSNTVEEFNSTGGLAQTLSNGIFDPSSLATDSSGDVYVANFFNNDIEEFNASGNLVRTLYNGIFEPEKIVTDSSGDVYVANLGNNSVEEFNSSGNLVQTLSNGVYFPYDLAVDNSGDVYVANLVNNSVEEFNSAGGLAQTLYFGINGPASLATDGNGDLYVANYGNNTVVEFNSSGSLIQILSIGVDVPYNLATDSSGDVYVANQGNNTVEEFCSSGALVRTLNLPGNQNIQNILATDGSGDLYVASASTSVEEFAAYNALISASAAVSSAGPTNQTSETITIRAVADVAGNSINTVAVYDNGRFIGDASANGNGTWSYTDSGLKDGSKHNFTALATDSAGDTAATAAIGAVTIATKAPTDTASQTSAALSNVNADTLSGVAKAEAVAGNAIKNVEIFDGATDLGAATLNAATGAWSFTAYNLSDGAHAFKEVITDNAGNTYTDSSLAAITVATQAPAASASESFSGLTASNYDMITVTASAENIPGNAIATVGIYDNGAFLGNAAANGNGVWSYDASGLSAGNNNFYALVSDTAGNKTQTSTLATLTVPNTAPIETLSSGINDPSALAIDGGGNVYVANFGNNSVEEFNSSGIPLQTLSNGIDGPRGLAVDSSGDIYVANYYGNDVEEFSASGNLALTLSSGINGPISIAIGSGGNVFVGNSNNTVEEFNSSGSLVRTLSNGVNDPVSIATNSSGDVFIANADGKNTVEEFNASGVLAHTLSKGVNDPLSLATNSSGDVYVGNNSNTVEEFNSSGGLAQTLSSGINVPTSLATDSNGNVYVANYLGNTVEEFNASGALAETLTSGVNMPEKLATDSSGNVYVANQGSGAVEEFASFNAITANASGSLTHPTVVYNPNYGNLITIPDAASFDATEISAANVAASGGSAANLAGWVSGALSANGADLAQYEIAWFNFKGATYLVEQANAQGTAFGSGDSLVQLVGVLNESNAQLNGHVLTL